MNNKVTAKQYLQQVSRLDKMINNKLSEIRHLQDMAMSITVANEGERVQSSGSKDRMGDSVAKMVDAEKTVNDLTLYYVDLRQTIISQIDGMPKESHYSVLYARYVEGKSLEEIASEKRLTFRRIAQLHGDALSEFKRIYGSKMQLKDFRFH